MRQEEGLVDLHVNGHAGIDFLTAKGADEIRKATRSLKSHGVAGFLASLITCYRFACLQLVAALLL